MDLTEVNIKSELVKPGTYPAQGDKMPLLCKLQNKFFLVHGTRIAGRMLLGDQKRRHNILASLVFPEQQTACLLILRSVNLGD